MLKMQKKCIWAEKKNRKTEKKRNISGLARNRLKLSKSPKNRFVDQYCSIYGHFSAKKQQPQKVRIDTKNGVILRKSEKNVFGP